MIIGLYKPADDRNYRPNIVLKDTSIWTNNISNPKYKKNNENIDFLCRLLDFMLMGIGSMQQFRFYTYPFIQELASLLKEIFSNKKVLFNQRFLFFKTITFASKSTFRLLRILLYLYMHAVKNRLLCRATFLLFFLINFRAYRNSKLLYHFSTFLNIFAFCFRVLAL